MGKKQKLELEIEWLTGMYTRNQKCVGGNVEVAAINLDHEAWLKEDFWCKEMLSRVPEKGKMLADRLFCNPGVADKILDIPVSEDLSGPNCTLKSLECAPFHGL